MNRLLRHRGNARLRLALLLIAAAAALSGVPSAAAQGPEKESGLVLTGILLDAQGQPVVAAEVVLERRVTPGFWSA